MKIIGFAQLRNELEKGNLENWFKCMLPICDCIYIFDQNSTDGSLKYYDKFDNIIVVKSPTNRFKEEVICKNELLQKIITEQPDTDWIFWMDGDTLLDGRLLKNNGEEFKKLCNSLKNETVEGYTFGHKNLWRSDVYYRNDNNYDFLDDFGVCALWRFRKDLYFQTALGLHTRTFPANINYIKPLKYKLVHRGFATDYQILLKYEIYKERGQHKDDLDRLLDESNLILVKLDEYLLPEWFEIKDNTKPTDKIKILDIYNKSKIKNVEVISMVYKSVDYLYLIYNQLKSNNCKVDGWDVGIRLVLNDATEQIIDEIKKLDIPYTIYNDENPSDYYLNRVYRCWNFAGQTSEYDNICFVNSDMIFSKNWLKNLLKHHNGTNIPCSRLVESGKMFSGKYGISLDFGKTSLTISFDKFNNFIETLAVDELHEGGLYMPCVFNKNRFIESGMYPEGNIYTTGIGKFEDSFVDSGDNYFFNKLKEKYGMKHVTPFDSLVYHIQEGEKDEIIKKYKVVLYCQIGGAIDMAEFAINGKYGAIANTGLNRDEFEIIFICWKTPDSTYEWLNKNKFKYINMMYDEGKGFLWNLYKGWNLGYEIGCRYSDYVCPIATDHAFHKDWLKNLLKHGEENRIVNCKLIEPGTLNSLHTIMNFGLTTTKDFNGKKFMDFCKSIEKNELILDESKYGHRLDAMPFLLHKSVWNKFGPMNKILDENGITGDTNFFNRCKADGVEITKSLDAISYHCGGIETKRNQDKGIYT